MKFYQTGPLRFEKGNGVYSAKQIIEFFKEGNDIEIEDEHGQDVTKEFMLIEAFGYMVPLDYVAKIIDQEELENILWAGGYENWNIRQLMGAKK